MRKLVNGKGPIKTALLLAAGTGSRLHPLTGDSPKCLTEVHGVTILQRLLYNLRDQGIEHLVVVLGHLDDHIRDFLGTQSCGLTIRYLWNARYRSTNNIYSLWLARRAIQGPLLLVECDLVFDAPIPEEMLQPDRIAVSEMATWMTGTTVAIDQAQRVTGFQVGGQAGPDEFRFKTVNMYSFSLPSWRRVARRLEQIVSTGRVNEYYETVFAEMVADGSLSFQAVAFDNERWYEIDTLEDLYQAEQIFLDEDSSALPCV